MLVEVEQGSAEWLQLRTGRVTGSRMADVMLYLVRKNGEAAKRQAYKSELVSEILTGRAVEHFVTREMQWGLDNEIFARNAYEIEVAGIDPAGFAVHPTITRFGASPDGLIGADGLIEFKCPNTATHINYVIQDVVPAEYHWQMLAEMACSERQWCDFVSYDPRLPKKLQLFVRRLERDNARIAQMEAEVLKFLAEVDEVIETINRCNLVDLDPTLTTKLRASIEKAAAK
jgi:hypothetical protein